MSCFAPFIKTGFVLQLDDKLAQEVAPNSGGAEGLRQQLLRMQNDKTAQDNQEAVDEAMMAAVVNLVDCEVPKSMIDEMGKSEYQARLLQAQAKVGCCSCA